MPSLSSAARTKSPASSSPRGGANAGASPTRPAPTPGIAPPPGAAPGAAADSGDRATARRADEVGGEALLAGRGQTLEAHEREVEEGRGGYGEIDIHAGSRIAVIPAPQGPAARLRTARPWRRSRARRSLRR